MTTIIATKDMLFPFGISIDIVECEHDNADDTLVAGEQGEDADSTASTELDDLPDDHAYRILQKLTAEQTQE